MHIDRRGFIVTFGLTTLAACGNNGSESSSTQSSSSQPSGSAGGGSVPQTIDFTGLIAVAGPTSGDPRLNFLLVDGQNTISVPHTPQLVIADADIASTSVPPATHATRHSRLCSFWNIAGYDLTIASANSTVSTVTGHRPPGHQLPANAAEKDDVTWIAEMNKIPGIGMGKINPACLGANPTSAYVAARVRCGGELAARFDPALAGKPDWSTVGFQFKNGSATYTQALGLMRVTVPASQPVTLTLTPYTASGTPITIQLTNGAHRFEVLNEPGNQTGCPPASDITQLKHFAAYYKLVDPANPPGATPLPECTINCPTCSSAGGTSESDYVHCPGGKF